MEQLVGGSVLCGWGGGGRRTSWVCACVTTSTCSWGRSVRVFQGEWERLAIVENNARRSEQGVGRRKEELGNGASVRLIDLRIRMVTYITIDCYVNAQGLCKP